MRSLPSRRRAAAAFALVGLIAGAAHVLASDAQSVRLWREVLPLAILVGAVLGAVFRPSGGLRGALIAVLAILVFAFAYGVAETAILANKGEIAGLADWPASILHWTVRVLEQSAVAGLVAALGGAAAGWWLAR